MPESMRSWFLFDGLEDVNFVGVNPEETLIVPIGGWVYSTVMSQWSMLINLVVANDLSAGMTQWSGV